MLGCRASIYRNQLIKKTKQERTDIKQDQKYQRERTEKNHR